MPTGPPLRIYLLGQPRFIADGSAIKLAKRAATVPLAAYLLLHRAEPVSRNFLAFTLWADQTEETALAELRRYIYLLNKALGPNSSGRPWIVADSESIRWNDAAPFWLDVSEFERLSADPATLSEAAQLYGGDLVEDLYDDWLIAHRERLRSLYFADLGALIVQQRESRQFQRAIAFATQLLASDPWREDVVRQLMACRYESGDAAGALAAFDDFVKRLRRELAVDPMPETIAMRDAIVRHAVLPGPAALRAADPVVSSPEPPGRAALPFVGRTLELEQLQTSWSRAARASGCLILIGGEAGIGKSRLAAELARVVDAEGGRILVGSTTCPERVPYECIADAIRSALPLIASLDVNPLTLAIIDQLVPELSARRSGLPELPHVDPQRERSRLLDAIAGCLAALARVRPMLVVFEDLHWAGAATIAALGFLARRLARAPILMLATYRDEETGRAHPLRDLHRDLRGEQLATTLSLRRLPRSAIDDLMAAFPVPSNDASGFANAIFSQTEGNPLFLTEALRDALDHPDAWRDRASGAWAGTDRLRTLIADRCARLSPDGKEIAEVAAVIGHGFNVDVIHDVTGFTEERVLDGIDDLLDRHFIREAGGRGRFEYAFTHQLVHASIYEAASPQLRSRRHRRVARILEERSKSGDVALAADLALHHERGGDGPRAATWYLAAAESAERVYAHVEAIQFASRAIELTRVDRQRAAALCAREIALSRTGDRPAQRRDIDEAMQIASRIGDDDLTWQLLMRLMHLERSLGRRDEEGAVITELERRAGSANGRRKAEALLARANHLIALTSHVQADGPAREALRLYESLDDVAGQVEALSVLTEIATNTGDLEGSRRLLGEVRKKAASQPDKGLLLRAISAAIVTALQQHRIGDAADLAAEGVTLAHALGDREEEAAMLQRQAVTAIFQGDFELARRRFAAAAEAFDAIGHLRGLSHAQANQAVLAMRLGLLDEAQSLGDRTLLVAERTGDRRPLVVTLVNLSLVHTLRGDPVGAKRLALQALELSRAVGFPLFEGAALANLGNAERALGDAELGLQHIKEGLRLREGLLSPTDVLDDYCDLAVAHLQAGQLAHALSATAKLLRIAEKSLEGAFWPHVCFWTAAIVHHAAGNASTAGKHLRRAVTEMRAFAARISDPHTRAAFLALPACREVEGAAARDEWPKYARGAPALYDSGRGKGAKLPARRTRPEKSVERRQTKS